MESVSLMQHERVNSPPTVEDNDYDYHPFFLRFKNSDMEEAYRNWAYHTSPMYNSKIWTFLVIFITLYLMIFQKERPLNLDDFSDPLLLPYLSTTILAVFIIGSLFIPQFHYIREYLVAASAASHWPVFIIFNFHTMYPMYTPNTCGIACIYYCAFVSGLRFQIMFWIVVVAPVVTLALTTVPFGYFSDANYAEAVWVLPYMMSGGTLWFFEIQQRRCFIDIRNATIAIAALNSHMAATREVVSRLFPKFAIRQLLSQTPATHRTLCCLVTDVKGFTAWSASTPLDVMMDSMTELFVMIERIGHQHEVERVCTLGDSYVGVIPVNTQKSPTPQTCARGLQAALTISVIDFIELKMRVGLHIGPCACYFVGSSPMQFDVIGEAMTTTKNLEQTGEVGSVHVSPEVLYHINEIEEPVFDSKAPTEFGFLVKGWTNPIPMKERPKQGNGEILAVSNFILNWAFRDRMVESEPSSVISNSNGDIHVSRKVVLLADSPELLPLANEEDAVYDDNNGVVDFSFHKILLRYNDVRATHLYEKYLTENNFQRQAFRFVLALEVTIFICNLCVTCIAENVIQNVCMGVIIFGTAAIHQYKQHNLSRQQARVKNYLKWVLLNSLIVIAVTQSPQCNVNPHITINTIDIAGVYFVAALICGHFSFHVRFVERLLLTLVTTVLYTIMPFLRRHVGYSDMHFESNPSAIFVAVFFSSYFIEFFLMSSFAKTSELRHLQESTARREHEIAINALNVMMPKFAAETLVSAIAKHSSSTTRFDGQHHQDNARECRWQYPFVCVMFLDVMAPTEVANLDRIFAIIEDVLHTHGVWKVKCIGSSMLCVSGIEDQISSTLLVRNALDCLIQITEKYPTCRSGLDCGPCVGAIVGGTAYSFDVFGDTVNRASRLLGKAPPKCVVISQRVYDCVDGTHHPQTLIKEIPHTQLKGLGNMAVYAVEITA